MTTLLQPPPSDAYLKIQNGFSTLDEPSQLWLSPSNISQDSKDLLLESPREEEERIRKNLRPSDECEAHASFTRKPRRSSSVFVSRDDVTPERARHLERNRVAAKKCRKKKKKEHEHFQSILQVESAKRATLLAQVNVLKEEVWQLKNSMFEHADCADRNINLQLAMMTQNMLGANVEPFNCPTLTFSASTRSDGSMGDGNGDENRDKKEVGDNGRIKAGALENIVDPMPVPDLENALFESFIEVTSMKQ